MKSFVVLALAGLASFGSANLLSNGSFEDPVVDQTAHRNEYGAGANIGAWTVASTNSSVEQIDNDYNTVYGSDFWWSTPAGNQYIYMASFVGQSEITQSVNLTAGTQYDFSFLSAAFKGQYGTAYGSVTYDIVDGSLNSAFGGPQTIVTGDNADWSQFGSSFTAGTTGTYMVKFDSVPGSASLIDNVQLNSPVPEPLSLTVLGAGALAVLRRRARK
jgi:hypothetical protein